MEYSTVYPLLIKAKKKFKEIKTYFTKYKNPIGIEIEAEFQDGVPNGLKLYWQIKEDHSLRGYAAEFVSVQLFGQNIDYALHEIQPILESENTVFSHRTSIHIHQNVSDFTVDQLDLLIALYAVFEDYFFAFVDPKRKANSFCYPITDIRPMDIVIGSKEQKYCALNVGNATSEYGTVEYRHLHGTGDIKTIRRWIQLIIKLHHFVESNSISEVLTKISKLNAYDSNTTKALMKEVFGTSAFLLLDYVKDTNPNVIWAKFYLESRGL